MCLTTAALCCLALAVVARASARAELTRPPTAAERSAAAAAEVAGRWRAWPAWPDLPGRAPLHHGAADDGDRAAGRDLARIRLRGVGNGRGRPPGAAGGLPGGAAGDLCGSAPGRDLHDRGAGLHRAARGRRLHPQAGRQPGPASGRPARQRHRYPGPPA